VKLVLTVVCRDEADVLDAMLAFNLNAGVDFVLATDHGSSDGTRDVLERYVQQGRAHVVDEEGEEFRQDAWGTRMARLAATDFAADWVIHSDADEFWWPRGDSLKDVLEHIPARYGIIRGLSRIFVPQLDSDACFAERMTVRLAQTAPINDPTSPYRPTAKIAHRADPDLRVGLGNHALSSTRLVPLRGWNPIEVLHFPLRRKAQVLQKYAAHERSLQQDRVPGYIRSAVDAAQEGTIGEMLRSLGADPGVVADGLASGVLVRDTRLRDVLRELAGVRELPAESEPRPVFSLPRDGTVRVAFPHPTIADDVLFAVEAAVVAEADHVRLLRRLDEIGARVTELERRPGPRLARLLRRLVRSGKPSKLGEN
jgi:hypothetical protein